MASQVLAERDSAYFNVNAGTTQYIKVRAETPHLKLAVSINGTSTHLWNSTQPNLQHEILAVGPFDEATVVHLTTAAGQAVTFERLPAFKAADSLSLLLKTTSLQPSEEFVNEAVALIQDAKTASYIRNYIKLTLGHRLIQSQRLHEASRLANLTPADWSQELNLQCQLLLQADALDDQEGVLHARALALESIVNIDKNTASPVHISSRWFKDCQTSLIGHTSTTFFEIANQLAQTLSQQVDAVASNWLKAITLGKLWVYLNQQDKHSEADLVIRKALALTENEPDLRLHFQKNHSTTLVRLGKFGEAQQLLSTALNDDSKQSELQTEIFLFNKGFIFRKMGEFETSRRYFEQILAKYKNEDGVCLGVQNERIAATILTQIGVAYREELKPELANDYFLCALKILGQNTDFFELTAVVEYAKNKLAAGDRLGALEVATRVLNDQRAEEPQLIVAQLILLEVNLASNNQPNAILNALELAKILRFSGVADSSDLIKPSSFDNPSLQYAIQKVEFFSQLIRMCETQPDIGCETGFFNLARSILLKYDGRVTHPMAWNAARYELTIAYVETLIHKRSKLDEMTLHPAIYQALETSYSVDVYSKQPEVTNKVAEVTEQWLAAKAIATLNPDTKNIERAYRLERFRETFLSQRPAFIESKSKHRFIPLLQMQQNVQKDELLLRYFVGQEYAFVMSISSNQTKLMLLSIELLDQIGRTAGAASKKNDWHELLPPEAVENDYRKIVVIPDHTLHHIPFSAINISANQTYEPLASKSPVIRTHNFSDYFSTVNAAETQTFKNIAVFAADSENPETAAPETQMMEGRRLLPIPGVRREIELISRSFAVDNVIQGVGEAATLEFLSSPQVRQATILHIATHGLYNPENPELVGFLVASNGQQPRVATLNQVMAHRYTSSLVVISGCDTMLGKHYRGSGLRSLSRGFIKSGAGAVLGTLWPISDQATTLFMETFYKQLSLTGNVSLALQNTRNQIRKSVRYRNPRYWAGFALTSTHLNHESLQINQSASLSKQFN